MPALTLGVENLLVTSDSALDEDALNALESALHDAGVQNMVLHTADEFMTAMFSI